MPIKYLPIRGATNYTFGGGGNNVQVLDLSSTVDYHVDLGGGSDYALLGAGDDVIVGGTGGDYLQGGEGDDTILGGPTSGAYSARKVEKDFLFGDRDVATSTYGNDFIRAASGEVPNNTIRTDAYGDTSYLVGQQGGEDTIRGGAYAQNRLSGDASVLDLGAVGGNDSIDGGASALNSIYGDAIEMVDDNSNTGNAHSQTRGGDDRINGGNGSGANNGLVGDAYHLYYNTVGGNDVINCGDTNAVNFAYGDAIVIYAGAQGGNDVIYGGHVNTQNTLYGDAAQQDSNTSGSAILCGDDILYGGEATLWVNEMVGDIGDVFSTDVVFGDDTLFASGSRDRMYGDARGFWNEGGAYGGGADNFVFTNSIYGLDEIGDFSHDQGDKIYIVVGNVDEALSLLTTDTINEDGVFSTIVSFNYDQSNSIKVVGVSSLTFGTSDTDDIIFVTDF